MQRDELGGILALDPGLDEPAQRRADDVDRLDHLIGGTAGSRRGIVQLVREPGGHRAQRGQPLAVLLDRGDTAHDGRDLLHHAPVHGGLGERQPAELGRLDDSPRRQAWSRPACARPSVPSVSAPMAPIQVGAIWRPAGLDVLAGDEEGQHRALEQEEHAGRQFAVLDEDLARFRRPRPRDGEPSRELLVVQVVEEVDRPQLARA